MPRFGSRARERSFLAFLPEPLRATAARVPRERARGLSLQRTMQSSLPAMPWCRIRPRALAAGFLTLQLVFTLCSSVFAAEAEQPASPTPLGGFLDDALGRVNAVIAKLDRKSVV